MNSLLNTLMSIAGQNRAIGTGDVVPHQRSNSDSPNASQSQAATPGPSSPGAAFDPTTLLSNLSALTPGYNAALAAANQAAIPSGTASAVAQPLPGATPGPSSSDVAATQASIGGVPVAGSPGVGLAPATAPVSANPSPGDGGGAAGPGAPGDAGALGESAGGTGAPGTGDAGAAAGAAAGGPGAPGTPGGADAGDAGAPGDSGGDGGGVGDGSGGVYKKGGFVAQGKPNSKTDDVSAKLQHGEFVIPRDAVIHLAAHAPQVLSHVMHVSAQHHLANKAAQAPAPGAMLTGQNGGMPPQPSAGPVGYRNGGLVMPGAAVPQIHPAALDLIRRAIAAHAGAPQPVGPTMPPPQMARGSAPVVQGRPAPVPPMERLDATKSAAGGARNSMTRKSGGI